MRFLATDLILVVAVAWFAACAGKPAPYQPEYDLKGWDGATTTLEDGKVIPLFPDAISEDGLSDPDGTAHPEMTDEDGTIVVPDNKPQEDKIAPRVIGAFSSDGITVSVRFSEPVDPSTGGDAGNYSITGSDMSQVEIASVEHYKQFAHLTLANPAQVNSAFTYTVLVQHVEDLNENVVDPTANKATIKRSVYLTIVWHQHQPSYLDPVADELTGPWVRKHATKDYYDMASMLEPYPDVHVNMNITPVMMTQMLDYYVERLGPYVDTVNNTVDEAAFLGAWAGRTDPWIDLLLEDTPTPQSASEKQLGLLYKDPWACVSTSDQIMMHFPQYVVLREKNPALLTQEDFLQLKILFEIAWIDPDFLDGPVNLPDGTVIDLTDIVTKSAGVDSDGDYMSTYTVTDFSEEVANRLVAEEYKIMANIVAIHKQLMYDPATREGQIEITTTPFYHPILPLIYDTNLAKAGQPYDNLPNPAFSFMEDAYAHVLKAKAYHEELWGIPPYGMWCGEGSVAEEIIEILVDAGLLWTATDQAVLDRSNLVGGGSKAPYVPFKIDVDTEEGSAGSTDDEMAIIFRDTALSNKVGFTFQMLKGEVAASEFMGDVMSHAPNFGGADRLVVVILDGENAWESYKKDLDGKSFFFALYQELSDSYEIGEIVTVTMSEYILGNPERGIPAHPVADQKELEPLHAGSWIDGTFGIWIGEPEENQGWEYLLSARKTLQLAGLNQPNPEAPQPSEDSTEEWLTWNAYEEIYAAEGSDWFWWYGADMTSPANDDTPFDKAFRVHLNAMYSFMNQALVLQGKEPFEVPDFAPIVQKKAQAMEGPFEDAPTIDGLFLPSESEWDEFGGFFYDNDSGGTMAGPMDDIAQVYFGYKGEDFYLGLLFNEDLSQKLNTNYSVSVYTNHKHVTNPDLGSFEANSANTHTPEGLELLFSGDGAAWQVKVDFSGPKAKLALNKADGKLGWNSVSSDIKLGGPVQGGKILEFKIPFESLEMAFGDPLEIFVVAAEGDQVIDTSPYAGSKVIFDDITTLVYVTFEVDVSGTLLPVDAYVSIENPPPPAGKGIVYIAGNQDVMGNWIPNKIPLIDSGQAPDKTAGDQVWTGTFGFAPGTMLRYKYTSGLPKDEAKWPGTEEFPLTERGLDVTQEPGCNSMLVQDVFADRPNPTGTSGPNTEVTEGCD
jgi:alpha-amylase/alpha-mannosidase (GH57 family)